jgi:hypothetical protein
VAESPRLVQVTLTDDPDEERLTAILQMDGNDTLICIEVDDEPNLHMVVNLLETARAEFQVDRDAEDSYAIIALGFNRTGYTESVDLLTGLLGGTYNNLLATFWYAYGKGDESELSVLAIYRTQTLLVQLHSARNVPAFWDRLAARLHQEKGSWRAVTVEDDCVHVVLNDGSWQDREVIALQIASLATFNE